MTNERVAVVRAELEDLQGRICAALEDADGAGRFRADELSGRSGGVSRPRVLEGGEVLERAGVNFSHTFGAALPPAATQARPEMAGASYTAVSVSLIVHPRNPYAPTSHANFRFFQATPPEGEAVWWFGGGFDLTPYYGFEEDAVHWHRTAKAACDPHGQELYPRFKAQCDAYFFLKHRDEPRGIGGLFFDDWNAGGFEVAHALWKDVAEHFLPAYLPILARRKGQPFGERERAFQLMRRGRYVEFNLIQDRGTLFGLQAGGRAESILVSLPPLVAWRYDAVPAAGSPEAALYTDFLRPRDWAAGG